MHGVARTVVFLPCSAARSIRCRGVGSLPSSGSCTAELAHLCQSLELNEKGLWVRRKKTATEEQQARRSSVEAFPNGGRRARAFLKVPSSCSRLPPTARLAKPEGIESRKEDRGVSS